MSTKSNKPVKSSPLADAVAGQPAESQPKTTTTPKAKTQPKTRTQSPKSASSRTVEAIKSAAKKQAQSDAASIVRIGEQVYAHELEKEIRSLMGGASEDYFRAPVESWTLPHAADTEQLEAVEVAALPSQN